MSTESLVRLDDSGKTIYFAIFNETGQVFDFGAGTPAFVDLDVSNVEPYLAATEYADAGGLGKSQYIASLNLATINNTAALVNCTAIAFEQSGGSPDLTADSPRSQPVSLAIQFGLDSVKKFQVRGGVSTDSTNGSYLEVQAWLEAEGEVVPLSSGATCVCNIRQIEASEDGIQLTAVNFGTVNEQYVFEFSQADPELENDHQYRAEFTITQNGVSWKLTTHFVVLP